MKTKQVRAQKAPAKKDGRRALAVGTGSAFWCKTCNSEAERSVEHDAYFCRQCNEWLEATCGDPAGDSCIYCANRPEHPIASPNDRDEQRARTEK